MSNELSYLRSCACVDAMDRITSKTFLRLSHEYGICFLRRELIPTIMLITLKSIISNIVTLMDRSTDISAYINLYDIVTLGLVELNFEETEKATNILPDFRIGPLGCKYMGMDYERYSSKQVPLEEYGGRILNVECCDTTNKTWNDLIYQANESIWGNTGFRMNDYRLTDVILKTFLEEVFYDLGDHKEENYVYKLFDILYFNYKIEDDMWGTDVMPEYKLMVKNDAHLEDFIYNEISSIEKENKKNEESSQGIYWQ